MKIVIVGNSKYSVMLMDYIEEDGTHVDAFCVNKNFISEPILCDKPVVQLEDIHKHFQPDSTILYMGIGYAKLGNVKASIYNKLKEQGYNFANYVHPSVIINKKATFGEANVFFENVVIQRNTTIGNGNLFFTNSVIMHDNQIGNFNTFGACSVLNGNVTVEDCSFIGSNATIRNDIKISKNSLIGAGAYLSHDTEYDSVVTPAKSNTLRGGVLFSEYI